MQACQPDGEIKGCPGSFSAKDKPGPREGGRPPPTLQTRKASEPATLAGSQLALLVLWLVGIVAALIFALVTVATITLLALLYQPVSTDGLAGF